MTNFRHHEDIWRDFPGLVPGVLRVGGITPDGAVDDLVARYTAIGRARLAAGAEGQLPEIQAWRRAFAVLGLKPTQYRCAAESLLRRLRKEDTLPRLHPLVDLCNAVSVAFAVPVAALDADRITGDLVVRRATGAETYATFGGQTEHPDPGEVVFADDAGRAHARRWTNRQSGDSAIGPATASAFIVAEGLHDTAAADVARLVEALGAAVAQVWGGTPVVRVLTADDPSLWRPGQPASISTRSMSPAK